MEQSIGEISVARFGRQAIPMVWDFAEANPFGECGRQLWKVQSISSQTCSNWMPANGIWSEHCRAMQRRQLELNRQGRLHRSAVLRQHRLCRPVGLLLCLAAPLAEGRSSRTSSPRLPCPRPRNWSPRPIATAARSKAEAFFLERHDAGDASARRAGAPSLPSHHLLRLQAVGERERRGHRQHRLGNLPRRGDPRRLRHQRHLADADRDRRRIEDRDANALASSIVLVCRPRAANAPTATRREFVTALKAELPEALTHLQRGNIAPVDLAQAAIGPGMAVYTRYAKVLDAEGKPLSVREALALINQTLDEALAEQEGDFDADSRWALAWFEQSGFAEGEYGVAETLSKAKNTSVAGMVEAGILASKGGKVRLLRPDELPADWDPETDPRLTAWESVHHLVRALEAGGENAAAELVAKLGGKAEIARELAYRLYTVCERKKRAQEALSYNGLVQSWPEITRLAREGAQAQPSQPQLFEQE